MHKVCQDRDVFYRTRAAQEGGATVTWNGLRRWTAHQSGRCERPFLIEWTGRKHGAGAFEPGQLLRQREPWRYRPWFRDKTQTRLLDQWLPCRKCRWCRQVRSRMWAQRAQTEIEWGQRTWFGTLTLRPDQYYLMSARARSNDPRYIHQEISKEITLYIKRLRKASGAKLRYIVVAELHKSGNLHYHMLVTETPGSAWVKHAQLRGQWKLGFTRWKLTSEARGAARYVSKYLAKEALARVRASKSYGEPPALNDVVAAAERLWERDNSPSFSKHSCDVSIENGTSFTMDRGLPSSAGNPGPQRGGSTTPPPPFPSMKGSGAKGGGSGHKQIGSEDGIPRSVP